MFHILTFENGQINRISSVVDETIAKMISEDYENCAYFDDEDNTGDEKLIEWLQLRGLNREEAMRVIERRIDEIRSKRGNKKGTLVAGGQAIPIMADSLQEAIAQVLDRIRDSKTTPDLSGIIDRFDRRISREACGACFVCGEIAASHKECMEPGGAKCCQSAQCDSCGAAMAAGDTAAEMAYRYRTGPLDIIGTLSNLFKIITESESAQEFPDWSAGILTGGPSLDSRLADPKYRPVTAALANALRDRAEIVEKLLMDAGKEDARDSHI